MRPSRGEQKSFIQPPSGEQQELNSVMARMVMRSAELLDNGGQTQNMATTD